MKTILTAFSMVAVFAACNSNPSTGEKTNNIPDQKDLSTSNAITDKPQYIETQGINDSVDQHSGSGSGSFKEEEKVVRYEVYKPAPKQKANVKTTSATASKKPGVSNTKSTANQPVSAPVAQTAKKKGWSKAAKGTAIGAGSGAVLGAVISKKKGKGAIIGGVIGAAGGYVIGHAKDKKDGRN